jgi:tape measure domain-containing protein
MVAQVGALRVTVGADITGLKTGMARAQREVSRGATAMQKSVSTVTTSFRGMASAAGLALGAAGVGIAVRSLLSVADASKQLTAQLKLATAEYGSFAQAQKDVRAIAEGTRSDLLATSELYAALQRNSGQLGTTQEQVARATETVAKSFKISGAATSEQTAATRQLIQAFQSGVLRGDEFNSVMENAPRLAKLLADSLGVTVGQLRAMAHEGELTSDKLVKAFTDTRFTDGIDQEFKQLPVTFDEAMGQVRNAAVITFGAFDQGGQFSTALANFITGGTQGFADLEQSAYQFGVSTRALLDGLDAVRDGFANLHTTGISAFLGLEGAAISLRDVIAGVLSVVDATANSFANLARIPYNIGQFITGNPLATNPISNLSGRFTSAYDKSTRAAGLRRIMSVPLRDILAEHGMGPKPPPFRAPAGKSKKGGSKGRAAPRDRSADVEFQFAEEMRSVQMQILQAQRSLSNDYQERARISLQILDLERIDQQAELDNRVRKAERDFAEKKITKATLDEVKTQAAALSLKNEEVIQLKQQEITNEVRYRQAEEAASIEATKLDIQQEQLQSESQLAETATDQRSIQLRLLDLSYRIERARLETVLADEQASAAAKEEARLRLAALDARHTTDRQGVINSTRGPMEQFKAQFSDIGEELEQLKVNGIMGAVDALTALTEGWGSFRDAALSAIKQVIAELIRLQLMKLAASFISGATGSFAGAGGGAITGGGVGALNFGGTILGGSTSLAVPGMARGGSGIIGGFGGVDRNLLSLNGLPIARVSRGEGLTISPDGMGAGGISMTNHFSFSGPVTRQTEMQLASVVRRTITDASKRGY